MSVQAPAVHLQELHLYKPGLDKTPKQRPSSASPSVRLMRLRVRSVAVLTRARARTHARVLKRQPGRPNGLWPAWVTRLRVQGSSPQEQEKRPHVFRSHLLLLSANYSENAPKKRL